MYTWKHQANGWQLKYGGESGGVLEWSVGDGV